MNPMGHLRYHANVSLLGRSFLRVERLKSEWKMKQPDFWKGRGEHLAPPLEASPWLKELISRHYLKGRYVGDVAKVAWVTSGAPVEFLTAMGFFVIYPENHGAVCGIRRKAESLCAHAENAGWSQDICSYARTDIGSVLSGKTPVGRLPRPDVLLCCTNICQTVLYWYRVLAHHFRIPLILVDTPFLYREATPHAIDYVKDQLDSAVEVAERVSGKSLVLRDLERVVALSKEGSLLWAEIMATGRERPAPITAFDEFIHMAPIVEMRGLDFTVDYYRALLAELRQRVKRGVGAVVNEKRRLIWDNLPIWHWIRRFSDRLSSRGVALVASTYTNAWGELAPLMNPRAPLESGARVFLHAILNRGTGHKLKTMMQLVEDFHADGVILHSDRSCKPYSIGQMDQRERFAAQLNIPALLLEADHNDPRAFSEEQVENRIDAFLEVLDV